jgi:hypothetical protein
MLELDYSMRLETLIQSLDWQIQLPPIWSNFFDEVGKSSTVPNDERQNVRKRVRTLGVMHFDKQLPSIPRPHTPIGIYSRDFSRRGCGFVSPFQVYPQEIVRLIMPTFWIRLLICRARRIGPCCYEIGGELIEQNLPSPIAFEELCFSESALTSVS